MPRISRISADEPLRKSASIRVIRGQLPTSGPPSQSRTRPCCSPSAISGVPPGGMGDFLPLAKSLGASAILRKPLDRENLISTVRGVITQDERRLVGGSVGLPDRNGNGN